MFQNARAHATVAVSDADRARKFYEETLGLSVTQERPDGTVYETGGTEFLVYPSAFAGTSQATVMAFEVDDLDASVDDLIQRGVTFEQYDLPGIKTDERGIAAMGGVRGGWFKDPDGNILAIAERPS
jgi:catechol 2,3-dioxygenase-like lactoylglutathione lyase family enzyme